MTKDYLKLILLDYNPEDYIKEFGGYYAGIIDNYVLIFLDFYKVIEFLRLYDYNKTSIKDILLVLNNNKYNNFDDYLKLTRFEMVRFKNLYDRPHIKADFCRRIYLDE